MDAIREIRWIPDDTYGQVRIWYEENGKRKKWSCEFLSQANSAAFMDGLRSRTSGQFDESQGVASIWHVGLAPIIFSVVAMMFLVPTTIGAWTGEFQSSANVPRRSKVEMFMALANALGPVGTTIFTLVVLGGFLGWWWWKCGRRPAEMVLTAK